MKKINLLFLFALVYTTSFAQISVVREDYALPGEWYLMGSDSSVNNNWDVLLSGSANATWDVSALTTVKNPDTSYFVSGFTYPTAPAGCTLVEYTIDPDTKEQLPTFYNVTNDAMKIVFEAGSDLPITGMLKAIQFPSTFNTNFKDSLKSSQYFLATDIGIPANPLIDSLRIDIIVNMTAKVDGYGTLKMAAGNFDVLRQKSTVFVVAKFFVRNVITRTYSPFAGIPDQEQTQINYTFFGKNSGNYYISAELGESDNISNAQYMLASSRGVRTGIDKNANVKGFKTYPNPVNNNLNIAVNMAKNTGASLIVYNLLGNAILVEPNINLTAGNNDINVNTDQLSSGVYLYNLSGNGISQTGKFVKQ